MNEFSRDSEMRRSRPKEIGQVYAAHDGVSAIIIGGSVARGWADRWSDLELCIVWDAMPADEALQRCVARAGGTHRRVFPSDQTADAVEEEWFTDDGLKVDLYHRTRASIDRTIDEVVTCANPTWENQVQVEMIRSGIGLHGTALLETWRSRAAYPDSLPPIMVKHWLRFGPHAWLEMLAEREDTLYLNTLFCEVERCIIGVLLGINRAYPPAANAKWLTRVAGTLPVAPDDFPRRLTTVFQAEPRQGVRELGDLVDETLSLVERHVPQVDTAPVRDRVNQRRPTW
jgi:hypothetical protein